MALTTRHRSRWPWILFGGALAATPLACTAGDDLVGVDLPDTTPWRTTLVEVITTTTTVPPATSTAATPGSAVTGSTVPPGAVGQYTVVAGDYWIGIAGKLGVTLEALLAANDATTATFLFPGQTINVPPGGVVAPPTTTAAAGSTPPGSTSPVSGSGRTYTVVEGDYWIGIAQKLGVALDALLAANGATTSTFLFPGQTLNVP